MRRGLPGYTVKPDVRSVARYIIEHGSAGEVLVNRSNPLSNRTLEYYLEGQPFRLVSDVPDPPPARLWLVTNPQGTEFDRPYTVASRHGFDEVTLLEMRSISPKNEHPGEPLAKPGRSD